MKNEMTVRMAPKWFLPSFFVGTIIITGVMIWLFKQAAGPMAAETCFKIAQQLQNDYKATHSVYAVNFAELQPPVPATDLTQSKSPKDLGDFPGDCQVRFEMKIESAGATTFLISGKKESQKFLINQLGEFQIVNGN